MASFRVNRLTKTVVAAALPRQDRWLPQSNLDLIFPCKLDMGVVFCYKKPPGEDHSFGSVVNVLKKSLSEALVPYYPVAGEMVANGAGETELLCNNRGVDFEEAYADVELRDLNLYKPEESIQGKLLPELKNGVLAAQVTQLSCGGVVLGCTFDHRIADGYSASMFWKSWAEMARSKPLSCVPSFRRSLLSPRRPGTFDSSVTDLYAPISELPHSEKVSNNSILQPPSPFITRMYSVSADQIHRLQLLANHENPNSLILKRTKLEAFSAFLWKLIASGTNTGDNSFRLGVAVDGRTRISDIGAMSNYFGNVVSSSLGIKKCKELKEMPLSSIANEIHKFLHVSVTKEHFLGLIDFVEAHRPKLVTAKIFGTEISSEEPFVAVSSARSFPIMEMDFGWGTPVFGSYFSPPESPIGLVVLMPSPSKDGDWLIYIHLYEDQVQVVENVAAHVFKPFCLD